MVPSGMPPRAALPYMLTPLLLLIEKIGLVTTLSDELVEAIEILKQISKDNLPKIPTNKNQSKQIAMRIGNTVPVIYAFGIYGSIAHRFKQQFNENSKIPSAWDIFSELNHNEIVGWEQSGKFSKKYSLIFLRDKIEPIQIKSRIEITKSISSLPLKTFDVWSKGNCDLAKMLSILCIGDFASVYHAILNNIDPTPVNTINLLKKKIIAFGTKEKILIDLNKFQI
jgi:glucose/mannose-6-phosphate isomerase